MMTQDELAVILDGIDGWLNEQEAYHLYTLAARAHGDIIEIGSYRGRSTIALAQGITARKTLDAVSHVVYAIDPHEEHEAGGFPFGAQDAVIFDANIADLNLQTWVVPVRKRSLDALATWTTPIDLIFIDGAHDYENVHADFIGWSAYLTQRGRIAVHDSTGGWEAPTRVVQEMIASGAWVLETQIGYTSVLKRGDA